MNAPTSTEKIIIARRLKGTVVSNAMQKTLVVEVKRLVQHPLYKKRYTVSKRYKVHYETGKHAIGDAVIIEQTRPISKGKRWKVVN